MKVVAGGQNRFHGWNEIVSADFGRIGWQGPGNQENQTIAWSNIELHLNGEYKVQISFTKDDLKSLAPRLLGKDDLIALAGLTDAEKISLAKSVMAKLSDGDKPDIQALFGMVEAMLPRAQVIALLHLTDEEKIELARETLRDMTFGEVVKRLYNNDVEAQVA